MKSQIQIFYQEQRRIANLNAAFSELVKDGMTREELAANIECRPDTWSRFAGFLTKLPSSQQSQHSATIALR